MERNERLTLSIEATAQKLGISRNLAFRLARENRLPGVIHLGGRRMVVSKLVIEKLLQGNGEVRQDDNKNRG